MTLGPVQVLVIGFAETNFHGQIKAELERLRASDTIRLLDVAFVRKDEDGNIQRLEITDLAPAESEEIGAIAGALIGLGAAGTGGAEAGAEVGAERAADHGLLPDDVWYIEDALGNDQAAAVALIEHRWAIGLRDAIRDAGGFHLADAWIHPLDLVSVGLIEAEEADAQIFGDALTG
jgi:uncharacterized membrane protein